MLIENEDWSKVSDSDLWHAAKGGAHGAAEALRRREAAHRVNGLSADAKAAMASRARNGRPQ